MRHTRKSRFHVTAQHELIQAPMDPHVGVLMVTLYIRGVSSRTVELMRGPILDIQQFMDGDITEAEVTERWKALRPPPGRKLTRPQR